MDAAGIIAELKKYHNPKNISGMARFGITGKNIIGGPGIPVLRKMAGSIGKNHGLALELWDSGIHEARILASMVDDPKQVTGRQMDLWVRDFDSWDICDQACSNLFADTPFAHKKVDEWVKRDEEFVRRAGFVLITAISVHDKKLGDGFFIRHLKTIKRYSHDERNFVRKAVNWALRQVGKRNRNLNRQAIKAAREIYALDTKSSRWIACDALRELQSEAVQGRVR